MHVPLNTCHRVPAACLMFFSVPA